MKRLAAHLYCLAVLLLCLTDADCQSYPSKPIRIVTSGAGGGNDLMSRYLAQGITPALGQPLVVDNRANILIIAETVMQTPADGYTIMFASSSLWVLPLMQKTSYDALRDFIPVSMIDRAPSVVVVNASLPVNSVAELIALAKSKPGELNYSFGSPGSAAQLAGELLKSMTGTAITGVPYKGTGAQVTAAISGEVQLTFASATSTVMQQIKGGKLRPLAVTSLDATPLLPGVPTVAALLPGYNVTSIDGVFVRTGTPAAIINRLNQEIVRFTALTEVKDKFTSAGIEMTGSTPDQFTAIIKSDVARLSKVIKDAGIHSD